MTRTQLVVGQDMGVHMGPRATSAGLSSVMDGCGHGPTLPMRTEAMERFAGRESHPVGHDALDKTRASISAFRNHIAASLRFCAAIRVSITNLPTFQ